ncbi:MAG: RIP metalloprotease RseP [Pseudomonadota bacterium]
MLDLAYKAAVFVAVLGLLIAFHEFGHFWVARRLGVKVLRYSIGFGRPLWRYQARPDSPEYVIAAIPLGGYVKMLDESEGEVAEAERHLAFNRQPLKKRFAIVAAGPLANLLLAAILYAATFAIGINSLRPVIDTPAENTAAAQADLQRGDIITAVAGEAVDSWQDLRMTLLDRAIEQERLALEVNRDGARRTVSLPLGASGNLLKVEGDPVAVLGFSLWEPQIPAVLDRVIADSPAARAGLESGDRIVSVEGRPVNHWADMVDVLQARPGEPTAIQLQRKGQALDLVLTPERAESPSGPIGRIGVTPVVEGDPYTAYRTLERRGPVDALVGGVEKTAQMSLFTVKMLWQMITGNASLKHISGPLTIADLAGDFARYGIVPLLQFMAVISVSLGVLNLLPVPVLDGGHLVYYTIEAIKGSPVSERTLVWGQQFGLVLLAGLMTLAIYNDLSRIFG